MITPLTQSQPSGRVYWLETNDCTRQRSVESGRILVGEEYISHSLVLNADEIIGRWMGSNADQTSFDQIKYILEKEPVILKINIKIN